MDDFLILSYDKSELYMVWKVIEKKLGELKLTVNPKSAICNCSSRGGCFFRV